MMSSDAPDAALSRRTYSTIAAVPRRPSRRTWLGWAVRVRVRLLG